MFLEFTILILGVIGLIAESNKISFKKPKLDRHALTFGASFLASVIGGILIYNKSKEDQASKKREIYSRDQGAISPKATPNNEIIFEHSGILYRFPDGVMDLSKKRSVYEPLHFIAYKENGKIYVDTDVKDSIGQVIAKISKNEWVINPQTRLDKNFDDNAIEVIDRFGSVVFQLELIKDTVKLQGLFYLRSYEAVVIRRIPHPNGERDITISMFIKGGGDLKEVWQPLVEAVNPIFKYPSLLHMGERETVKRKTVFFKDHPLPF